VTGVRQPVVPKTNIPTLERPPAARPARVVPVAPRHRGGGPVRWLAGLFALSVMLAVVGRASDVEALALTGGYGVLFFGIGAAPFQLLPNLDLYARLTGAVLVGFSVLLAAGGLMADLHGLWNPVAAAVIVGGAAAALHAIGLIRAEIHPVRRRMPALRASLLLRRDTRASLVLTAAGTGLWLAPALWTRDPIPDYWGLLTTISPLWYAGLVLVIAGFVIGRRTEISAALPAISFGLATTLTPALVYGAPREQTAAKQMVLTQYVLTHHHMHVTAGIYQAYSSTFSGVAALSQLLGIHGLLGHMSLFGLATYWPVLLVVMRVVELRFLAGRLLAGSSRRWCAVMLVMLVDSLGADYFSPQSIGYVLAIGSVAMAIDGVTPRPLRTRGTLCLLTLVGVALGPTHELSPYLAAGALIVLALFGQAPWWSCIPIGLPALAWAGVVHRVVSQNFTFGALFNLSNFRPPVTVATPGLHRLTVVGVQSHVLLLALLILIALGTVGLLANVRTRWAWAYALCPIVGLTLIAVNPYGNEGIFRATLFAIPWMAILAMKMPQPGGLVAILRRPHVLTAAIGVSLTALLGTFLIAAYSMDATNVLPRDNLALVSYLQRLPRQNAFVLPICSADNPADGVSFALKYTTLEWSQATRGAHLQQSHPTAVDAIGLAKRYAAIAPTHGSSVTSPLYVVWAHSSLMYCHAYGLQSPSQMQTWLRLLRTSPEWQPVHRSGHDYLFRLR
jgi:hypothetical protein